MVEAFAGPRASRRTRDESLKARILSNLGRSRLRAQVRCSAELAAARVARAAAIFLNEFPKHEEDCAQDCAG
jgi:hypothetical protein